MKTKYTLLLLSSLALLFACNKEDIQQDLDEAYEASPLEVVTASLLCENENGDIELNWGVPLNDADPTVVCVEAKDYEDAYWKYSCLFSENTETNKNRTEFILPENEGRSWIENTGGNEGIVAKAYFDIPSIPQISQINYILPSAIPDNAGNTEKCPLGMVLRLPYWEEGESKPKDIRDCDKIGPYVCVRESGYGQKAMFVGMTVYRYIGWWGTKENFTPTYDMAKTISKEMNKYWDFYIDIFKAINPDFTCNNNEYYTVCIGKYDKFYHTINMKNRDLHSWSDSENPLWEDRQYKYLKYRELTTEEAMNLL